MTSDAEFIPAAVAAVVSGAFVRPMDADDANRLFTNMLRGITLSCVAAGSTMIGHIKANVRSGDEMMSMSSTTDDGNVRCRSVFGESVSEYSMTVNVIVYGIDNRKAAEALVSNVRNVLGNVNVKVSSEIGCGDPGCGDPMCRDAGHSRLIIDL